MKSMRKVISLLLVMIFLVNMLPCTASAEGNAPFSLTEAEVREIQTLSGMETDVYHAGMPYSRSMSAYQVCSWLREFNDEKLTVLIRQAQLLIDEIGNDAQLRKRFSDVFRLKDECDRMSREVLYFVFQLDEQMNAISNYHGVAKDNSVNEERRSNAYRQMQRAALKLKELLPKIGNVAPGYENQFTAMNEQLSAMHGQLGTAGKMPPSMVPTTLIGAASPFAALASAGFYIDVLKATEAGFYIVDENDLPLPGAAVTVSNGKKTVTGTTDDKGIMKYDTGVFSPDADGKFLVSVYIEATGKQIWESCGMYLRTGGSHKVKLPTDDGTAYIQRIDFRGMDVLHDQDVVYCSPENDAVQPLKVYVHAPQGRSGNVALDYTDESGNTHQRLIPYTGDAQNPVRVIDLSSEWAKKLSPNTPFVLSLEDGAGICGQTVSSGIVTEEAIVDRPITKLTDPLSNPGINLSVNIPMDLKALKNIEIAFNIPTEIAELFPISFALTPDGEMTLGISFSAAKDISKNASDKSWKTVNSRDAKEERNKAFKQMSVFGNLIKGRGNKEQLKGEMKELMSINEAQLIFNLMLVFTGKYEINRETNTRSCDATLMFQASIDGSYTFQTMILACPPVFFGFSIGVGFSAGASIGFSFSAPLAAPPMRASMWKSFDFHGEQTSFMFGLRFSFSAWGGVGVRGLAAVYLRGFFGINAGITLTPWADDVLNWYVDLDAKVDVVVEALFVFSGTFTLLEKQKSWPDNDNNMNTGLLLTNDTGEDTAPDGIKPHVSRLPADMNIPNGMKTVCLFSDETEELYLGFYTDEGQMKVLSLYAKNGSWRVTELNTNGQFGRKAFADEPKFSAELSRDGKVSDSYVYDFAVTNVSESQHESMFDRKYVGVALLIASHREDVEDPDNPGTMIPGRTYGETLYLSHTPDEDGARTLKTEGGMKITPRHGCYMETSLQFSYIDTVTGGGLFKSETESYYATVAMRSKTIPHIVFAHGETVNLTHLSFPEALGAITADSFEHEFNLQDLDDAAGRETVLYWSVSAYRDIGDVKLPFGADRFMTLMCTALIQRGDRAFLYTDSPILYKTGDRWGLITERLPVYWKMDFTQLVDSGDIRNVVELGTVSGSVTWGAGALLSIVFRDPDENGLCKAFLLTRSSPVADATVNMTDLGIRVAPADYHAVRISEKVIGLYYLTLVSPDADERNTRYVYNALYLVREDNSHVFVSKPFMLAVFDREDLDPLKGLNSIAMIRSPAGFLEGVLVAEETTRPGEGSVLEHFTIHQTPRVRIDGASLENPLVRAGDTVNILVTVTNTGNIPVSAFYLDLTAENVKTKELVPLSSIKVDCAIPDNSSMQAYDLEGARTVSETGEKAVSRFETPDEDRKSFWEKTDGSSMQTVVLMPEETVNYRVPFPVPMNFAGNQYNVSLDVSSLCMLAIRGEDGRYDSTGSWIYALEKAPVGLERTYGVPVTVEKPEVETITAVLTEPPMKLNSMDDTVPVTLVRGDVSGAGNLNSVTPGGNGAFSAYGSFTRTGSAPLDVDTVDVALDTMLYETDGKPYVSVILNNGSSAAASGLRIGFLTDGKEIAVQNLPESFTLTCAEGLSMDIPLEPLLDNAAGVDPLSLDRITVQVSCNETESNYFNNKETIYLNRAFVILQHPDDRTVPAGKDAAFSVVVRGGTQPYTYQWQVSANGRYGTFTDIPGANGRVLNQKTDSTGRLKGVAGADGTCYRCVITDANGRKLVSDPALLLLTGIPRTGDTSRLLLWAVLLCVSLLIGGGMCRKYRRQR